MANCPPPPEFALPEGSHIVLHQEVVIPPHPDAERGEPHPEVAPVLNRLTPHYEVTVFGRHPAVRLRNLVVNGDVTCVGHHGLELLRGDEPKVVPAAEQGQRALWAFATEVKSEHECTLARLGATLRLWDHALALDWRLAGDRERVALIATVVGREATRRGLFAVETSFALDILPAEPDEEGAIALLTSHGSPYGRQPALMRVAESGSSRARGRVAGGRLVHRGVVSQAIDIEVAGEFAYSAAQTSRPVVIHGVARSIEISQPLDGIAGVIEMLGALVPPTS